MTQIVEDSVKEALVKLIEPDDYAKVEELLDSNQMGINESINETGTVGHNCAFSDKPDSLRVWLSRGGDPYNVKNKDGQNVEELASSRGSKKAQEVLEQHKTLVKSHRAERTSDTEKTSAVRYRAPHF